MSRIVIHAGMHKAGSTSVQRWISANRERLLRRHGVQVLVAARPSREDWTGGASLQRHESGGVNSSPTIRSWIVAKRPPAFRRRFIEDLARLADESPTVLITGEELAHIFCLPDEPFLLGLEELARDHDVRVAFYVRPQHGAIEARWKQSGYKRRRLSPSDWVLQRAQWWLHYARVLDSVGELAPRIAFGMRPFVREFLDGGSPVQDFVRRFLSLEEPGVEVHANPGFPLELVNLLRAAPAGSFWAGKEMVLVDRYPRPKINALLDGLEIRESPKIRRSRRVLQQHCHEVFESDNQRVIRWLGWPVSYFVPPAVGLDDGWSISELDLLWAPDASEAERAVLYHALHAALA